MTCFDREGEMFEGAKSYLIHQLSGSITLTAYYKCELRSSNEAVYIYSVYLDENELIGFIYADRDNKEIDQAEETGRINHKQLSRQQLMDFVDARIATDEFIRT